jgi:hypothetical protein
MFIFAVLTMRLDKELVLSKVTPFLKFPGQAKKYIKVYRIKTVHFLKKDKSYLT